MKSLPRNLCVHILNLSCLMAELAPAKLLVEGLMTRLEKQELEYVAALPGFEAFSRGAQWPSLHVFLERQVQIKKKSDCSIGLAVSTGIASIDMMSTHVVSS